MGQQILIGAERRRRCAKCYFNPGGERLSCNHIVLPFERFIVHHLCESGLILQ